MGHTVRSHTRKTASGGATTVRQHSKAGRPHQQRRSARGARVAALGVVAAAMMRPAAQKKRKKRRTSKSKRRQPPSLGRRGWNNVKRSWRAARAHKKWAMAGFAGLATIQIGTWVGLNGLAATATTVAIAALGTAALAKVFARTSRKGWW